MKKITILSVCLFNMFATGIFAQQTLVTGSLKPMPDVWIDKETGHKIVRLTGPTGNAIKNWYFHNNPFFVAPDGLGDKMVFMDVDSKNVRQVFALNMKTFKSDQLTFGPSPKTLASTSAQKTHEFIFQAADSIYAGNPDTKKIRLLYVIEPGEKVGLSTVTADATMVAAGSSTPEQAAILKQYPAKSDYFNRIYDAHLLNTITTFDLRTGVSKKVHEENNWLGHVQFSPVDPDILLFCHEGPWEKVDRIWRYNIKTEELLLMHKRSMQNEIAGHEFFAPDGKTVWFDLQKPKGKTFFLSGTNVQSGKSVATYQMTADEWSIHFAVSPENDFFAGDGGDSTQVARAKNGQWIYLFHPEGTKFRSEKLVDMRAHIYREKPQTKGLEPNVHITPDGKWIVFGGNFEGTIQTYAVEIAKSAKNNLQKGD